jgi:ABC-type branched-subunit amino acid transport system permease subunit
MEPRKTAFNTALKYSVITALAAFIFSVLLYVTNLYLNQTLNYLVYVILVAGLVFTVKDRRDKDLGGYISFGQAFNAGFLFCILFAILSAISSFLMMQFIAPDMVAEILKQTEKSLFDKGMSEEQVEMAMGYTKKFMTPAWMALFAILATAIFGAIFSLIVAAIFKKNNPQLQPPL